MKFNKWKFIKDRMYEIYLSLGLDGFMIVITLADVDFELHLQNYRERLDCEERE